MLYTSINNQKIKKLKKLQEKKYRDLEGKFLVEGYHLVEEAYKEKLLEEVIILEDKKIDLDINISYATKEIIKYLSTTDTPQDIIGICKKQEKKEIGNKIIVLDDIQDPGNLGAIIRSSIAFNFDTIILSEKTVDLYNPKVIRSTQGMLFKINIIRCDILPFIMNLKDKYQIITTNVTNGKNIKAIAKKEKICIIVGNEGNGVKKEIEQLADDVVYIDISSKCESLNVAIATSIILYELGSA